MLNFCFQLHAIAIAFRQIAINEPKLASAAIAEYQPMKRWRLNKKVRRPAILMCSSGCSGLRSNIAVPRRERQVSESARYVRHPSAILLFEHARNIIGKSY